MFPFFHASCTIKKYKSDHLVIANKRNNSSNEYSSSVHAFFSYVCCRIAFKLADPHRRDDHQEKFLGQFFGYIKTMVCLRRSRGKIHGLKSPGTKNDHDDFKRNSLDIFSGGKIIQVRQCM